MGMLGGNAPGAGSLWLPASDAPRRPAEIGSEGIGGQGP